MHGREHCASVFEHELKGLADFESSVSSKSGGHFGLALSTSRRGGEITTIKMIHLEKGHENREAGHGFLTPGKTAHANLQC